MAWRRMPTRLPRLCSSSSAATQAAWSTAQPDEVLANATPYLQAFGHVVVAWLWLDVAVAATRSGGDFAAGKLAAARYFFHYELPKISAWLSVVAARRRHLPHDARGVVLSHEHTCLEVVRSLRPHRARHRRVARSRLADCRGARRGGREGDGDVAQGRRSRAGRGASRRARHRRALGGCRCEFARGHRDRGRRDVAAPRRDRHPRQQRRRHVGRAGRRPSARGVGQGDEPQCALDVPDEPGGRQALHDPAPRRPHHQRGVDRGPGRHRWR